MAKFVTFQFAWVTRLRALNTGGWYDTRRSTPSPTASLRTGSVRSLVSMTFDTALGAEGCSRRPTLSQDSANAGGARESRRETASGSRRRPLGEEEEADEAMLLGVRRGRSLLAAARDKVNAIKD